MNGQVLVICSRIDPASANIAGRLMELEDWDDRDGYHSFGNFRMICFDEELIRLRDLDDRIAKLGLRPDIVVFASRHKANDGRPWLGGHFTGNSGDALMGGNPRELAVAAPAFLKSFYINLVGILPPEFEISVEATHHGPTDMTIPSFFAEIGSTNNEWIDKRAGVAVARSILGLEQKDLPVFLGFGGGHYVYRQTRLLQETGICFGHLFSNYQMDVLDLEMVEEARIKSGASYVYLDKKSLRSSQKKNIMAILDELGMEPLREGEIRKRFSL
jgi:D-aminoacyl-tRNA deacylase